LNGNAADYDMPFEIDEYLNTLQTDDKKNNKNDKSGKS
jgi:hypothetical protein